MISKLLMLRNMGLLQDALDSPITMGKLNLIYAENGRGKSTLADMFRSLRDGDGAIPQSRKTLNSLEDPEIRILYGKEPCNFQGGHWSREIPELVVFDSIFVDENVYSGTQVDADHRKNLCRFALGQEGVQLARRVEKLNTEIKGITDDIGRKELEIARHINSGITVDAFLRLPEDTDIDRVIDAQRMALEAVQCQSEIASRPILRTLTWPDFVFDDYIALLETTIDNIALDAEAQVRSHIREHLDEHGEKWLEQGTKYAEDSYCPFCGSSLADINLFESYKGYFSSEYAHQKEIIHAKQIAVSQLFSEGTLLDIQNTIMGDARERDFWSKYTDVRYTDLPWEDLKTVWEAIRTHALSQLREKAASPLEHMKPSPAMTEAYSAYSAAQEQIAKYNTEIEDSNFKISKVKTDTACGDIYAARIQLSVAIDQKSRW